MPAPSQDSGVVIAFTSSTCCAHSGPQAAAAITAAARANALRLKLPPERALIGDVLRVVRAVDTRVAIQAAARERDADAGARAAGAGHAGGAAAVARRLMALLAEERRARLQKVVVVRAVRVVAEHAVFLDRLVRAHERPALLHVTGVAGLVDRILDQRLLAGGAVRVVAVGASYFSFAHRVVRLAVD